MAENHYKIGYIALSMDNSFSATICHSVEEEAAKHPNIELIVRDSQFDSEKTLAHVNEFAEIPVDMAIIFQIDERLAPTLGTILTKKRIKIIAQDIHIPMQTFFGINNQRAGYLAGEALGKWIQANWNGHVDRILLMTDTRIIQSIRQRLDHAVLALSESLKFDPEIVFPLDGGATRAEAYERSKSILQNWHDLRHIAVATINDESALGVLDTARELGREQDVAVVGQAATLHEDEFRKEYSRFIASTDYHPEQYGVKLIDLALHMLAGERVARENYIEPSVITREIFSGKA
jgi:ribose transport system substrate-binding protein